MTPIEQLQKEIEEIKERNNAIVPSVAFVISTSTISFIKTWWLRRRLK